MTIDPAGNLAGYIYPNGVATSYNYNTLNRLTSMSIAKVATPLASFTYTLGATGDRLSVTELSGRAVNYGYDDLYRLTSETISNDPSASGNGQINYVYDPVGNRLSRTSSLAAIPSSTHSHDANDRLTSDGYDASGNTITSGSNTYAFDFENRIISLTTPNSPLVTFIYEGDGSRIAKTVGGVTTKFLVDDLNPTGYAQVVEESSSGSVQRLYTHGHSLISQCQLISGNWATSFYGFDGHGSARFLTDASGAITDTYMFDPFGNLIATSGSTLNDYRYAGERFDPNLGFYYLRARYMNPSGGRFWTMDDFEGIGEEPLSIHKYLYAHANPTNNVDPSGHFVGSIGEFTITTQTSTRLQVGSATAARLAAAKIYAALTFVGVAGLVATLAPTEVVPEDDEIRQQKLFIYRTVSRNNAKAVALAREEDWRTGLSFFSVPPLPPARYVRYRVADLIAAGYNVVYNGGRPIEDIRFGGVVPGTEGQTYTEQTMLACGTRTSRSGIRPTAWIPA